MIHYPDHSDLIRKSQDLIAKFDRVQASGDAVAVEHVRQEMLQTHGRLSREVDNIRATELIKAAQMGPKRSLFETSPGATRQSDDPHQPLLASGDALPDGSFKVRNRAELKSAVAIAHLAKDKIAARKHILRRASELSAMDLVPHEWSSAAKAAAGYLPLRKSSNGGSL